MPVIFSKCHQIKAYLESEPADINIMQEAMLDSYQRYWLTSKYGLKENFSFFQLASLYGKTEHLKILPWSLHEKITAVQDQNYRAIAVAAANGHLDTLKYLESYLTDEEKQLAVKAYDYNVIRETAENGHLTTLKHLESYLTEEEQRLAVKANQYRAICHVAKKNHLDILKHLESHLTDNEKLRAAKIAISYAAPGGQLDILKHLENYLTDEEKRDSVCIMNYKIVFDSVVNGHLEIIKHLESHLTDEDKQLAVKTNNYESIRYAVLNGHLEIIKHLESHLTDEDKQRAVKTNNYEGIHYAALNGHLEIIKHLESHLTDEDKQLAVKTNNYVIIRDAALNGHLEIIKHLENHLTDEDKQLAVKTNNYEGIRYAALNGHLEIIKHLESHLTDEDKQLAVKALNYRVIRDTAQNGHLATLKHLEHHLTDEDKRLAVKANDYGDIRYAALNGHLEIIKHLESHLTDEDKQLAVKTNNYVIIRDAALNGHLEIIKHLENHLTDEDKQLAVKTNNYEGIRYAAQTGDLNILRHLENHLTDEDKQLAVKTNNYVIIRDAAQTGDLNILRHLENHLTDEDKQLAVKTNNYVIIRDAAKNGYLTTLKHLEHHLTDEDKRLAVKTDNYSIVQHMAETNDIATLRYLESHLTVDDKRLAVQANNYGMIRPYSNCTLMSEHFLKVDVGLAYAESHDFEYGQRFVYRFVTRQLNHLQRQKLAYEQVHPQAVFDVDGEEARLYFYLLRNLIRRGVARHYAAAEDNNDEIRLLLSIPAVKNLLSTSLNGGETNELLRLAYRLGNQQAAVLLLNVPAVRQLAEQNNFYSDEAAGGIDLRALTQDRESSMQALTTGEQRLMARAIQHYQPLIIQAGVANIIDDLREQLKIYYLAKPARLVKDDGTILDLPVSWNEFQVLILSANEHKNACQAYYRNATHSAWRYLAKPNRWMHERASYVCIDEHNHQYKWSTFEEYQPLIAMLWLAAQDEDQCAAPTDNHTVEGRINHFIHELMLLGRAHNWDKTRVRNGHIEEYDDLEGDRPSCYSGVKRRLFQSVIGHPLLKIITRDDLVQEIRDFARTYFIEKMAQLNNQDQIHQAFNNFVISLDAKDAAPLATLNISPPKQQQFLQTLQAKYGESFFANPVFVTLVQSWLLLLPESPEIIDHYHALRLDGLTGLSVYLAQQQASQLPARLGFFTVEQSRTEQQNLAINPSNLSNSHSSSSSG
ncbi:MAG: hypothetical protein ACOVQX_00390 [Legionella sp.]